MPKTEIMRGRRCAIVFFIGTTAELIKLLPVMSSLNEKSVPFAVIASGQNSLAKSSLLARVYPLNSVSHLSEGPKKSSVISLLLWWIKTLARGIYRSGWLPELATSARLQGEAVKWVVHGDTVSTLLGAILGRLRGYEVCHVEAGLRSFNLMRPFPEEICRLLVSRLTSESYCPNQWAVGNLKGRKSKIVDTKENTLVDSLRFALSQQPGPELTALPKNYFVFVLHRQENLLDASFVKRMVEVLEVESLRTPAIVILHEPTKVTLKRLGLLERLQLKTTIHLLPRLAYIDFTHLLFGADFILTDGGSNQEEAYFLGKPCLVLRSETERIEGLEQNVVISGRREDKILDFLAKPSRFERAPISPAVRPSEIIVEGLRSL